MLWGFDYLASNPFIYLPLPLYFSYLPLLMKYTFSTCIITDSSLPPIHADDCLYILWNSFSSSTLCSTSVISLPTYIDDNFTSLRTDYHRLLTELSDHHVFPHVKLSSFLEIEPGYSHFFSSQIFESSYGKSPHLTDLIKVLALKRILIEFSCSSVSANSFSPQLTRSINSLCQSLRIYFSSSHCRGFVYRSQYYLSFLRNFVFSFGTFFRYFFTWFTNRSTFKNSRSCMTDHLDQIILLSYFVNINLDPSCVNISPFWGELPKLLVDLSIDHCWLFHYSPGISKDSLVESCANFLL